MSEASLNIGLASHWNREWSYVEEVDMKQLLSPSNSAEGGVVIARHALVFQYHGWIRWGCKSDLLNKIERPCPDQRADAQRKEKKQKHRWLSVSSENREDKGRTVDSRRRLIERPLMRGRVICIIDSSSETFAALDG
jgi:hypothetical protein